MASAARLVLPVKVAGPWFAGPWFAGPWFAGPGRNWIGLLSALDPCQRP